MNTPSSTPTATNTPAGVATPTPTTAAQNIPTLSGWGLMGLALLLAALGFLLQRNR